MKHKNGCNVDITVVYAENKYGGGLPNSRALIMSDLK